MNASIISVDTNRPPETPADRPETAGTCPAAGLQTEASPAPVMAKRSLNILCIDDDEQILELMRDCLMHFEHRVKIASGGKRGLELFYSAAMKSEPYDVVITDFGMPDLDGYQVARAIRSESPQTPIVLMTGGGTIMKQGGNPSPVVDAVVVKPPRLQELNDLLLRIAKPA